MLANTGYTDIKELSSTEWNIVNDYVQLLKPIACSLDKLQGEKNVRLGCVIPCLFYIKSEVAKVELLTCQSTNTKVKAVGNDMKKALESVFQKRFSSFMKFEPCNREIILAAVTHPVYKFKWIDDPENNIIIARNYLETEMQSMHTEVETANVIENNENSEDEFLSTQAHTSIRRMSSDSVLGNEIFNFIDDNDKCLSMLSKYKLISAAFRKFNTTLSSSVPIERLFSIAMLICTTRRNRISKENFEKTLLLKKNKDLF